jgi:hypothetical protein
MQNHGTRWASSLDCDPQSCHRLMVCILMMYVHRKDWSDQVNRVQGVNFHHWILSDKQFIVDDSKCQCHDWQTLGRRPWNAGQCNALVHRARLASRYRCLPIVNEPCKIAGLGEWRWFHLQLSWPCSDLSCPLLRLCKITTFVCRSCDVGSSTSSRLAPPLLSKEDTRPRHCGSAQWLLRFEDLGSENILGWIRVSKNPQHSILRELPHEHAVGP